MLQRPELKKLRDMGYWYQDARDIIRLFENKVARYTGANHAIAVDCCTHAIELSLMWKLETGELSIGDEIEIPEHTYISAAMVAIKCGLKVKLIKKEWQGQYDYGCNGAKVIDAAVRWMPGMYVPESLMCLSFQIKKRIPIGRGGMILTDNKDAAEWFRLVRYDGRDMSVPYDHPDHIKTLGFHYYMTPEDAARGIILMDTIKDKGDSGNWTNYPNFKRYSVR